MSNRDNRYFHNLYENIFKLFNLKINKSEVIFHSTQQ